MARANSWILPRSTCMVTGSPVLPIALLSTGIASSLVVVPNRARECNRRRRGREVRASTAVLPADVGQVMSLVAGHGVGDGAYAPDGPVRWRAAPPGCGVPAAKERDERGAHRGELGHDIAERTLHEVGGRRVVGELDPDPHHGVGARDPERAVAEDALDVGHVGASPQSASCGVKAWRNAA